MGAREHQAEARHPRRLTRSGADPNFGRGESVSRPPLGGSVERNKKSKDPDMKKTVLVVDDSPTIRKIVQLCLKEQQIEVIERLRRLGGRREAPQVPARSGPRGHRHARAGRLSALRADQERRVRQRHGARRPARGRLRARRRRAPVRQRRRRPDHQALRRPHHPAHGQRPARHRAARLSAPARSGGPRQPRRAQGPAGRLPERRQPP